ncbi:MAG: TetR family transcriptional regulator [Stellaceae bacterium]
MARSSRRGSRGPGSREPDRDEASAAASEADRIIDAAFARIPTDGWRRLSLAAIAAAAELPILRVYRNFHSKQAILCAFFRRIDEAVLADPPAAEEGERPRDRLFDLMMRRLDALRPYKQALDVLRRELPSDPVAMLVAGCALLQSIRWMHEAADITTGGVRGKIAIKLTGAAYLATLRVWQRDDSADLGQTMAALDARLRRIERWLSPAGSGASMGEPRAA